MAYHVELLQGKNQQLGARKEVVPNSSLPLRSKDACWGNAVLIAGKKSTGHFLLRTAIPANLLADKGGKGDRNTWSV